MLKLYKFTFFASFIPLATAKEFLIEEKLPGPLLTRIEKLLSTFTLYFLNRFNMFKL